MIVSNFEDIVETVIEIISFVKKESKEIVIANINKPLTDANGMNMNEFEMTYLLLELMSRFRVSFEMEDVMNYKFNTIDSIAETISKKV